MAAESVAQTAGAATVTAKTVTGNTTEGAAKMIAPKAVTCSAATMAATSGKCAGEKPGTSESKDNCKNDRGFTQHRRPH
ncbi:hypothetical protein [Bradyrhizobium sp. 170]|uniref:hypothetical protein n=1 Tax=Bradyrhizobium sp. 170 TaxID=2782641 RepID=UPI0020000EA7|nr:hypothetical protein [Bradyrhizobium sp. 170]UPK07063.1 hypothetical protein IVB05_16965 [Bradyrhizobium sp. 170]